MAKRTTESDELIEAADRDRIIVIDERISYELSRTQRLTILFSKWGMSTWVFPLLEGYCLFRSLVKLTQGDWRGALVFAILAIIVILLFRQLFVGLLNAVIAIRKQVELAFDGQEFWFFQDGQSEYFALREVNRIRSHPSEFWLLEFADGRILFLPPEKLPERHRELIRQFRLGPPVE